MAPGAIWCSAPAPTPGPIEQRDIAVVVHGLGQHRADDERHVDRVDGALDLGGSVRVMEGVDVGGVLRPDDEAEVLPAVLGAPAPRMSPFPDVVVEDGSPLGVEVQPRLGHIALDQPDAFADRHGVVHLRRHRSARELQEQHDPDGGGDDRHPAFYSFIIP